jgi:hypothetical protein
MRQRWLRDHPGIGDGLLDPMDWAQTALEAAEPLIIAAERERIRQVVLAAGLDVAELLGDAP